MVCCGLIGIRSNFVYYRIYARETISSWLLLCRSMQTSKLIRKVTSTYDTDLYKSWSLYLDIMSLTKLQIYVHILVGEIWKTPMCRFDVYLVIFNYRFVKPSVPFFSKTLVSYKGMYVYIYFHVWDITVGNRLAYFVRFALYARWPIDSAKSHSPT